MSDFLLTADNVADYLVRCGLARAGEALSVRELGGGVSNVVLLIEWPGNPERRWVGKQSLGKLRVKDDWRSDRQRILREAEALQALRPVLGSAALPEVIHVDKESFVLIMTAAPPGSLAWKDLLLGRRADAAVAREAALLLAKMINESARNRKLERQFEDRTVFDQLRIDPYYRTTASRHPQLRREFDDLIATSLAVRTALVHGDYSPKNMLVRGASIFLIDFEVVHWGDPSFDAAFLLNHLFLKAFHQPQGEKLFLGLVREFWGTLRKALARNFFGQPGFAGFEALTVRHLGALMLARIDGKSPVEYIQDEETKNRARQAAAQILAKPPQELAGAIEIFLPAGASALRSGQRKRTAAGHSENS
jgi:5-methylthioribose kinase